MYQASVVLHILSAMVWVGGMLFLALVVVPVARRLPPTERAHLFNEVGKRFRIVGWVCVALLVATGWVNLAYRRVTWESVLSGQLLESDFGQILAAKIALVVAMIVVTAVHDFVVGPASVRALNRDGPTSTTEAELLRLWASWLGRASAVLALIVTGLATLLVRGV